MGRRRKEETAASSTGFVSYVRVSTGHQQLSGLGLDAQRAAVANYVASRAGAILAEYTEIESGKNNDRPQLASAMAACKRLRATLVIAKLDRLSRSLFFISSLMESGLDFVACDLPGASRLTVHLLAAVAENERELISARTKAGLDVVKKELSEKGFRISRKSGRKFTKLGNPNAKLALVKARASRKFMQAPDRVFGVIQALRSDGKSFMAIAQHLNELGIRTPAGSIWYPTSIRNEMLKHKAG